MPALAAVLLSEPLRGLELPCAAALPGTWPAVAPARAAAAVSCHQRYSARRGYQGRRTARGDGTRSWAEERLPLAGRPTPTPNPTPTPTPTLSLPLPLPLPLPLTLPVPLTLTLSLPYPYTLTLTLTLTLTCGEERFQLVGRPSCQSSCAG